MKILLNFIPVLILSFLFSTSANSTPAHELLTEPEKTDILNTLLAHNRAALEKIKTIHLEMSSETNLTNLEQEIPEDPPVGTYVAKDRVVYISDHKLYRSDRTLVAEVPTKNYRKESRTQTLLNSTEYSTVLSVDGDEWITTHEHASIDHVTPEQLRRALSERPVLPHEYTSAEYVKLEQRLKVNGTTWKIEQNYKGVESKFQVIVTHPKVGVTTYTFDPQFDFLITRAETVRPNGQRHYLLEVHMDSIAGVWYPNSINKTSGVSDEERRSTRIAIEFISINQQIDQSSFSFTSLGINKEKAVWSLWRESSIEPEVLVFKDDQWIPNTLLATPKVNSRE